MRNGDASFPAASERLRDLLGFMQFINEFRSIKRFIWYRGKTKPWLRGWLRRLVCTMVYRLGFGKENNGDHSFQVAIVSVYLIEACRLPHDPLKSIMYALVHDIVEIYAGDTPVVPARLEGHFGPPRTTKKERERAALERIKREWGERFPLMIRLIEEYEKQEDPESQFIRSVDKLVSQANIFLDDDLTNTVFGMAVADLFPMKRSGISDPAVLALFDELYRLWLKGS